MDFETKYNADIHYMFEHYILDRHWEYNDPRRMRTVLSDIVRELRRTYDCDSKLERSIELAETIYFRNEQRI